jgi:hypothetical protein
MHRQGWYARFFDGVNEPLLRAFGDFTWIPRLLFEAPTEQQTVLTALAFSLLCWVALALLVDALFDFARSRTVPTFTRHAYLSYILFLAGLPGWRVCLQEHGCMAGHMHHPPYGFGDYASDVIWTALFAASAVLAYVFRARWHRAWFWCLVAIVIYRIPFGSFGGFADLLELLIVVVLVVRSLFELARIARRTPPERSA